MVDVKNIKVGDIVYSIESWTEHIISCCVTNIKPGGIEYKKLASVDRDGKIYSSFGHAGAAWDNVFLSAKDAYTARENKRVLNTQRHLDSIKTVEDLISFPLYHCLNGEEYTDYDAVTAYKGKAKELLDIEIEM